MRLTRKLMIATVALLMVPAVTLASGSHKAKPVPNGNYCINCTAHKIPGGFHVSTDGKSIDHWDYYNNCARVPVPKTPAMKISKNETFHFKGTLKDVTGKKYQFFVKGHFVTSHLIEGVINATGGGRTCKAVSYKAKYTRTGPFQG